METIKTYAKITCLNDNCLNESRIVQGEIQAEIENGVLFLLQEIQE